MAAKATQEEPRLLRALSIVGWNHLKRVILAARATESPLLLIGPHGSAKTLVAASDSTSSPRRNKPEVDVYSAFSSQTALGSAEEEALLAATSL